MTDDLPDEPFDPADDLDAQLRELGVDVDEFADEEYTPAEPAALESTADVAGPAFFEAGADAHQLDDLNLTGRPSVLERLGPAHFRSKGFSFMGFLQTVYDHVAGQLKGDGVSG